MTHITNAKLPNDLVFLLNLKLGTLCNSKKVPSDSFEVRRDFEFDPDTDPLMLRHTKKLLDCPELNAIRAYHHRIRDYIEARELPTRGQFRTGMYMHGYNQLDKIETRLQQAQEDLSLLIDQLCEALEDRIAESRERLGTLFDENDYPTPAQIRERLKMSYEYQTLATPDGLKRYNKEVFEREQEKLRKRMEAALDDSRAIIAQQTRDLLFAVADRLTPDENGKPKIMRKEMIVSWTEALELLGDKNVSGDTDLAAVIESAKQQMLGREASTLKGDDETRAEITHSFAEMIARLDEQVIDKPMRQINLDLDRKRTA